MRSLVGFAVISIASPAAADGLAGGASAMAGWSSRGGPSALAGLEIGKRYTDWELAFAPRMSIAPFHGSEGAAYELGPLARLFVDPRVYVELAAGLALLPPTAGGSIPDSQPYASFGVGMPLGHGGGPALDLRAVLNVELGVQSPSGKSNVLGGLVGLGVRFE